MSLYFLKAHDLTPGDSLPPEAPFDTEDDPTEEFVVINVNDPIVVKGDKYEWLGILLEQYDETGRALVRVWNPVYMEWMNVSVEAWRIALLVSAANATEVTPAA